MKWNVHEGLAFDALVALLPPHYRERARALLRGDGPFRLLAFSTSRVVTSRQVARALDDVPRDGQALVAAAPNFTAEARDLLAAQEGTAVTDGDYFWTDESYMGVRQPRPR